MNNNPRSLGRRSQAESARSRTRILDRAERLLARAHYRQLYGKDVTDPPLKARTKDHRNAVIFARVGARR